MPFLSHLRGIGKCRSEMNLYAKKQKINFSVLHKQLRLSWPRTTQEAADLTEEQYRYLMMGLNPLNPKIKDVRIRESRLSEISFVKAIDISAFLITATGLMASTGGCAGATETPAGCLAGIKSPGCCPSN